MNRPPKNRISVAKKVHIPSMEASFCWGMSSNCSASGAWASTMGHRLLSFRRILVGGTRDDGCLFKVILGRWGRCLPLQTGCSPRISRGLLTMFERPDEVDQRQQITRSQNRCAGAGHDVIDLKFRRVGVITTRHPQITQNELREKREVKPNVHDQ